MKADERAEFEVACQEIADRVASLFEKQQRRLEASFNRTTLPDRGWAYTDVSQYLYAKVQRCARELLEERGILPSRKKHRNGTEWVFWAEESETDSGR
jgi:hypothetical protein